MRGAALIRVLLAVVIVAAGVDAAHAQRCSLQDVECRFRRTEGPPPTLPSPDSGKAVGAYIVGAIVTPGPEVTRQLAVSLALIGLYFLSIPIAYLLKGKKAEGEAAQ